MARGDSGESDSNTGIMLGAILGLLALAAFVVVAYVSYEDDGPPPASLLPEASVFQGSIGDWGLCGNEGASGNVRDDVDRQLRGRGYVAAGEWRAPQSIQDPVVAHELEGGCGVIVATTENGSSVDGHLDGTGTVTSCSSDRWAVASCGEAIRFAGRGDVVARAYVMPGVTPHATLTPAHLLAQAEAEHSLHASGFQPTSPVYFAQHTLGDTVRLITPPTGCAHYVVVGTGGLAALDNASPPPIQRAPFVRAVGACAGSPVPELNVFGESVWVSVRPYLPGGSGLARPTTAQISSAGVTIRMNQLRVTP